MSKLETVLAILDLKINESFKLKFGSECDPLMYKVDDKGKIWYYSPSESKWDKSAVEFSQLITQYADNIVKMPKNFSERMDELGLKYSIPFEWGQRLLKIGTSHIYAYNGESQYWETCNVTMDDLECRSDKIVKLPYQPNEGDVVYFLNGTYESPNVARNTCQPDLLLQKFMGQSGLLFSTEDGAKWSRRRYLELLK